ncbi:MAG TPA: SGNH/GDSL hydrolase family protein [Burkholderiaceae bacterium]|nr:SGNH/GDSL hydrolase family protein [Burkholderiaceae bacterium]
MKHLPYFPARRLVAMALAGLLTACGGGGGTSPGGPSTPTSPSPAGTLAMTALRIAGDSLSDSGTFQGQPGYGRIFSVQGSSSEPHTLWVERLAVASGLATPCPVYRYDGTAFARNAVSGCRNFAVGGARVHNPSARGGDGVPLSIVRQLQDAAGLGLYAEGEWLMVSAGANDLAELTGAWANVYQGGRDEFKTMLAEVLPASTVNQTVGLFTGYSEAGTLYARALADRLYGAIQRYALDQGARRVVVLNAPPITATPRGRIVLDTVESALGGGAIGAYARTELKNMIDGWTAAYNTQLAARAASETRVRVLDWHATVLDQFNRPAAYGLTNVTTPACPPNGLGSLGVPPFDLSACTAALLSARFAASGQGVNAWASYAFADHMHPTPYGHELIANFAVQRVQASGW